MRLAILFVLVTACAHDLTVRFPAQPGDAPGTLTFAFTAPASDVSIAVDGVLLVDDAHTGRVTIANVPSGTRDVVVAIGPEEKAMKLWIEPGKETTVPLGAPTVSAIDGWRSAFVSLAGIVLYALLR
jgi:anti-sigma-K factor RskA